MSPKNTITGKKYVPPELDIGCIITVDAAYKKTLLARKADIEQLGATLEHDPYSDEWEIRYNYGENSPPFDKARFRTFMRACTALIPADALDSVYLMFNDELKPTASLLASFEDQRRKAGMNSDYSQPLNHPEFRMAKLNISANGEPVRELSYHLPNDIRARYSLERNENEASGKSHDLIGECYWARKYLDAEQPVPFSEIHIDQMVRFIEKMRQHALDSINGTTKQR